MVKKHIYILISTTIAIKIVYLLLSYMLYSESKISSPIQQYFYFAKKGDAGWYEKISDNGYSEIRVKKEIGYSKGKEYKQSEWAFFPFYPYLISLTGTLLTLDFTQSAFIWSIIFSLTAILSMYWFGSLFFQDRKLALYSTLLLFCFPFSFYFSMFYTEALFFTLTVCSFIAIKFRNYLVLSLMLVPLVLLRPNGIVLLLPLYLFHLEQLGLIDGIKIKWKGLFEVQNLKKSLFLLTGPLAFAWFCFYQYKMTGFYFAFSIAQAGWYREFMFPILSFFRRGDLATQFNSIYTIVFIVIAILLRKKLPLSLNILLFVSFLLPLCSGSVTSMTRFISIMFPLFLCLGYFFYHTRYKSIVIPVLLLLHFWSFYALLISHPISF